MAARGRNADGGGWVVVSYQFSERHAWVSCWHLRTRCIDALINASGAKMDRRIGAHVTRTQFGQIMDLATKNNERFIVNRRDEPAVVIMSVRIISETSRRRLNGWKKLGLAPSGVGWKR